MTHVEAAQALLKSRSITKAINRFERACREDETGYAGAGKAPEDFLAHRREYQKARDGLVRAIRKYAGEA